jgi:hypothetical protein
MGATQILHKPLEYEHGNSISGFGLNRPRARLGMSVVAAENAEQVQHGGEHVEEV